MKLSGAPFYPQFAVWGHFDASLAAGASYAAPSDTIIYGAVLSVAAKLEVSVGGYLVKDVPAAGIFGFQGPFMDTVACTASFKNTDGVSRIIRLVGVSLRE